MNFFTPAKTPAEKATRARVLVWVMISSALVAILVATGFYIYRFWSNSLGGPEDWGTAGDYFGGFLGSFLAFLALLALIWSVLIQQSELTKTTEIMGKSVSIQKDEFEKTTRLLEKQGSLMEAGNAQTTFFALLSMHNANINAMQKLETANSAGRAALGMIAYHAVIEINRTGTPDKGTVVAAFERQYKKNDHLLGHYFRTLFYIFQFLKDNQHLQDPFYVKVARAQMSDDEMTLMMMNGLSPQGAPMLPFILEYHLLSAIILIQFGNPDAIEKLYPAGAFRRSLA